MTTTILRRVSKIAARLDGRELARMATVETAVVRYVVGRLREAGEIKSDRVLRDAVRYVRGRFCGFPPPAPSRQGITARAIRQAVAVGLLVEEIRRTCDARSSSSEYVAFLSLPGGSAT